MMSSSSYRLNGTASQGMSLHSYTVNGRLFVSCNYLYPCHADKTGDACLAGVIKILEKLARDDVMLTQAVAIYSNLLDQA